MDVIYVFMPTIASPDGKGFRMAPPGRGFEPRRGRISRPGGQKNPLLCSRSPWAGWSDTWAVYPDLAVRGRLGAGPTLGGGGPAR